MLTTLRNHAQSWLIKVVLGIIVITFVISFGIGTFTNPKEVLVKIGNREILVSEYMRQYQEELDRLRQRFPDNAETLAAQLNLRQQVLDRMVNRHLLLTAAAEQGLMVNQDEVKEAVTGQSAFQLNGHFDFTTYRQILAQNNLSPAEFESRMHDDLLLGKYQRNQIAGVIVGKAEIEQRYRIENERAEVDYVYADPARVRLPRPPSADELKAYYEAHPDAFTQPAQFKLSYFVLALGNLEEDVEVRDRAVERYYERNAEREFTTPMRVRASHILKRLPKDASPEQVAQASQALGAVLAKVRAGEDFAKLAKANSEDPSAAKGGDLGLFSRDDMEPTFADAAFSLPKGGISDIVRSPFGLHIIKVTDIQPGSRKSLDDVRAEIAAKLRTQRAERKLELELERLPDRLRKDGVEAVAKSFGVPLRNTPLFDDKGVLEGLGSAGPLYTQISKRRKGDVGVWRRNPEQGHVFYQIEDKKDAFVPPLESIKARVVAATQEQQRREGAIALAKDAFQKLQDGAKLESFAKETRLPVKTVSFTVVDPSIEGIGVNHEFQRAAFGLTAAQPYALNIKDEKAYLIRFRRRFLPEPDKSSQSRQQVADRMENALREYVLSTEIERLRAQVKVDVLAPEYLASNSAAPAPSRRAY
jgi:peptidyl-prolyl cis-trans isomerase D